ncbi:NADPH-dependent FMN reductase [Candidatus Burarchaeum australiense]|nr:NADPH-dependent FMN reductase [Candidatus Burarchaeum australiense]
MNELRHSDKELMKLLKVDSRTLGLFKKIRADTMKEAQAMAKRKNGRIKVLGISGSARDEFDTAQEASNSEELLKRCLGHCRELGAQTELIPLRKYDIRYCKACYSTTNTQCHFPCTCYPKGPQGDDMTNKLYGKLCDADVVLFATPVNNFKISTLMATFIDRCISMDGSLKPANPRAPKDRELNIRHMKFIELTADNEVPGSGLLRRFLGKVAGIIVTGHEEGATMAISNLFMTLNHFGMMFPPFNNMYAMASVCNSTDKDKPLVLGPCYEEDVKLLAENVMTAAKIVRHRDCTEWKYDYKSN